MTGGRYYKDKFYSEREQLIYAQIGKRLYNTEKMIEKLYGECIKRIQNSPLSQKDLTTDEILEMEPVKRQSIVAAIVYNDALWRLEAAYLMLCIGTLNVVYSNLRTCLESVVSAHIEENIDAESIKFLQGKKIDPTKLKTLLTQNITSKSQQ